MTLTELRYIVTLANERHFGRAAEKCHVSQPTLSVALKKVEQRYGITLFERGSSEVRLTPIGEQVAQQAERVLEESIRLREIAEQGKNPLVGPFRLGVIYTIAPYLLPRLIPAIHAQAPSMPIYLYENFTARLAEQLRRGSLDAVIVAEPFAEPGIVSSPVYDEPFCVVLPTHHPLAAKQEIPPTDVAGENLLLLGNGNCFRDQVVPVSAANFWPRDETLLQFRPFSEPAPRRRVVVAWRATFPRPQAIDVLRRAVADALPAGVLPA